MAYRHRREGTALQWWSTAAAPQDTPGTGMHAMAATTAQAYGSQGGNDSEEDEEGRAPGNGGSTGMTVVKGGPTVTGGTTTAQAVVGRVHFLTEVANRFPPT